MKSKKVLLLAIVAILTILANVGFVYADDFSVEMKSEVKDDTVEIVVSLKNIDSESGIYGLKGTLDYKTDIFEEMIVNDEGVAASIASLNDWGDVQYDTETKQFSVSTSTPVKEDTEIMKITLKLKENVELEETIVLLSDLKASNGEEDIQTSPAKITVEPSEETEIKPITSTPSPEAITTPKPTDDKLPQTGIEDNVVPVLFGAIAICLGSFVAYRRYKDI